MIPTMANKKPKKPAGNRYRPIGLRPHDALRSVIEACARKERRDLAPMCALLVEEALRARGYEVPDPPDDEPAG